MAYSLILDTTSKLLLVGLAKDDKVIDEISYEAWQRQSEFAIAEIKNILDRNQISPEKIDTIIVSKGPGSYTGVRIALTIAKVWTITNSIKIKALSSLQSMCGINPKTIAIIDARSNRFYVGMYDKGIKQFDDCIKTKEELLQLLDSNKDYTVVGDIDLIEKEPVKINLAENMLDLSNIVEEVKEVDKLVPIYLKEAYL